VPFILGKRSQGREIEKKREQLASRPEDDWEYSAPQLAPPERQDGRPLEAPP
jgi:hypothetical protein